MDGNTRGLFRKEFKSGMLNEIIKLINCEKKVNYVGDECTPVWYMRYSAMEVRLCDSGYAEDVWGLRSSSNETNQSDDPNQLGPTDGVSASAKISFVDAGVRHDLLIKRSGLSIFTSLINIYSSHPQIPNPLFRPTQPSQVFPLRSTSSHICN
ncbi:hypothetical protein L1987_75506 [Smallanthus sonchifolius]|uniref:Uncharacterized protein n=1 Tax=Smallanthus sonchifolius TaxID=185202 RepID=A0ACB9A698_9ASTR|nr:hypothetical protein L1987_75506 [Smallanthus sonchifolius]